MKTYTKSQLPTPGALVNTRSCTWKVKSTEKTSQGFNIIHCKGIDGIKTRQSKVVNC